MNAVFFAIVLVAFLVGGYHQWSWVPSAADSVSPMAALGTAMVDAAGGAVTLAIGLVGMMALFLGLMKVAEAGGLLTIIAKTLRPLMVRAFPEGIVKLRLTAAFGAQYGGFATDWSPVSWGSLDELFVNLTMPPR